VELLLWVPVPPRPHLSCAVAVLPSCAVAVPARGNECHSCQKRHPGQHHTMHCLLAGHTFTYSISGSSAPGLISTTWRGSSWAWSRGVKAFSPTPGRARSPAAGVGAGGGGHTEGGSGISKPKHSKQPAAPPPSALFTHFFSQQQLTEYLLCAGTVWEWSGWDTAMSKSLLP
jgi:hypothetical protein